MKQAKTGAVSGCIVWLVVFGILGACLVPAGMMIGGFTSVTDFAMQTLEPLICPDGTNAKSRSYATTTSDGLPSRAYVMQCLDAEGEVVKEDPVVYAFIWVGIVSGIGLILAGILAFVFAAPAGVLITRVLNRNRKPVFTENLDPT